MSAFAEHSEKKHEITLLVPVLSKKNAHINIIERQIPQNSIQLIQQIIKKQGKWLHPYYKRMFVGMANGNIYAVYETKELTLVSSGAKYNCLWQSKDTPQKNSMSDHQRQRMRYRFEMTYDIRNKHENFELENIIHTINKPAKAGRFTIVNHNERQVFDTISGGPRNKFQVIRQSSTENTSPQQFNVLCRYINNHMHFAIIPKHINIQVPININDEHWNILDNHPSILLFVETTRLKF